MAKTEIYYFAYGSNLSVKQMSKRCPHSRAISRAKIKNYKFAITGFSIRWRGGAATIERRNGEEVWGAVYKLDEDCLKKLDGFEGLNRGAYVRKRVTCYFANGRKTLAYTYIRTPRKPSYASRKYRSIILNGAKSFNLPAKYIEELKPLLG